MRQDSESCKEQQHHNKQQNEIASAFFFNHQLGNGYGIQQGLVHVEEGDLDVNSGLERSRGDLLHDLFARLHVDEALQVQSTRQVSKERQHNNSDLFRKRTLWMRISNLSQVLVPSPQGDLRQVMRRCLVGRRTGP